MTDHTPTDHARLIAAGIDPASRQPRERPVLCQCATERTPHTTFNLDRICDAHHQEQDDRHSHTSAGRS